MPRPISDKVPPTMRKRMAEMNIKNVKELAQRMGRSNQGLGHWLGDGKPTLVLLMLLLRELGYSCDSPEFELINEFIDAKGLHITNNSDTINEPVRIEQYFYRQSTVLNRVA